MSKKAVLIIMDGWGIAVNPEVSAIDQADTPFYDESRKIRPNSQLMASESAVGLPEGQMGNSEVGHTNIGAGRIVYQDLVKISNAFKDGTFGDNKAFREMVDYCRTNQKPLHLMGLLSDGGVHSHIDHLKGILTQLSKEKDFPEVYIHISTDGRDCDPHSGLGFVRELEEHISQVGKGRIASVIGRYFSMDRNNQWARIRKAYDLATKGVGIPFNSAEEAVQASYNNDITDEFIKASVIMDGNQPVGTVNEGDAVLFCNFRTDRGRQLTIALTQKDLREYNMHRIPLYYCTMTRYDETFQGVHVLFGKDDIRNGMGEVLANHRKKQIRIAETEKYAHVTFFFNGGREEPFDGERRILCDSPAVATYDLQPEMSAFEIRDKIVPELEKGDVDFVCLNFANPDMVGHTGVFEAAVKACETVDACTRAVVETAMKNGYSVLVTADHGNSDCMMRPDGSPHTAHTTAPVPLILFDPENRGFKLKDGKLGDLAPTLLYLMGIEIPEEMTGNVLVYQ